MTASPNRWRSAALTALWLQVAAAIPLMFYFLYDQQLDWFTAIEVLDFVLSGLVLAWWATLFGRVTLGRGVPLTDGVLRAMVLFFPLLTTLRLSFWLLKVFAVLSGAYPQAHPVAMTAYLTISGGAILANNAVYGSLVRLAAEIENPLNRVRLLEWLNVSAALAFGLLVVTILPIKGFVERPSLSDQVVSGIAALLDIVATLLAWRALQDAPLLSRSPEG